MAIRDDSDRGTGNVPNDPLGGSMEKERPVIRHVDLAWVALLPSNERRGHLHLQIRNHEENWQSGLPLGDPVQFSQPVHQVIRALEELRITHMLEVQDDDSRYELALIVEQQSDRVPSRYESQWEITLETMNLLRSYLESEQPTYHYELVWEDECLSADVADEEDESEE